MVFEFHLFDSDEGRVSVALSEVNRPKTPVSQLPHETVPALHAHPKRHARKKIKCILNNSILLQPLTPLHPHLHRLPHLLLIYPKPSLGLPHLPSLHLLFLHTSIPHHTEKLLFHPLIEARDILDFGKLGFVDVIRDMVPCCFA